MQQPNQHTKENRNAVLLILVAALGYFVDIYDLVLFNVVKKESLEQIMVASTKEARQSTGIFLFNMQMTGMLIGGILWGIWGDKKGRLSVLFGSIILYSAANIANAFVSSIPMYALIRIIAGIGLAGELGAGITLVAETMSKEKRGYGTMIIVTFGALGAVAAAVVGEKGTQIGVLIAKTTGYFLQNWQIAYLIGGGMGLALLLLRIGTFESGMFKKMHQQTHVKKGDIRILFKSRKQFLKYLYCILIGVPIWYIIGLLISNSQEKFAPAIGIDGIVINGKALMFAYLGLSFGDLLSGLLSQWLRSRKKVVFLYLGMSFVLINYMLFGMKGSSPETFYWVSFLLGTATGYWAIFVTIASEQFGTNIRSTVTNTVPNFVRGSVPLITTAFGLLTSLIADTRLSALIVGFVVLLFAFYATYKTEESFAKDLNYVE
jgi:putative MFS transporter